MSETTDAVIGAFASGYKEPALGAFPDVLKAHMDTIYPMIGDPVFLDLNRTYSDNADELKSLPGATETYHRKTDGKLSRNFRLASDPLTDFLSWLTGNITTSAASSA